MTREEWLRAAGDYLRSDPHLAYVSRHYNLPTILPSFPGRSTRTVMLGDIARTEETGEAVLLVSPLISSSLEVSIVLYWLMVRHNHGCIDLNKMNNRWNSAVMSNAGFNDPFKQCVPTERLIDQISEAIVPLVENYGEYPSQDVRLARRATQTTRLLKVECPGGHRDPYILRMSQKQYDRGAPFCGLCSTPMVIV